MISQNIQNDAGVCFSKIEKYLINFIIPSTGGMHGNGDEFFS
jgi:hypothetical protein